ncbi:MAG: Crp/Fnr family transcriptional regulator [Sphingomonas sp. 28-66-16]|nr:MAG: Crp/Fnr family transcriptional regulator [Sphingomonas sp. 28-66-16]
MLSAHACVECAVRDRALCSALTDQELATLNRIGQRRTVARHETLIWSGDDSVICAVVVDGILKLSTSTSDGREQTVGLLYPADFVGGLFADRAGFTVSALTDTDLCVFPRVPFEAVLHDHARMEHLLLERTFAALEEARGRMLMLARRTAEERVAGFLLGMADRIGTVGCRAIGDGPVTFDLPLTRGEIAELLGLTIETVSRQLSRLKVAGIIALPSLRAVTIRDRAALEGRAEASA